jgi:release factor glutamine methyltransferase
MLHTFMNVELEIAPGVLVPRKETELLARSSLDIIGNVGSPIVIDMCCGSGNLALAIARARSDARVFASDLTPETVATARHNAARLNLPITVAQGDMFAGLHCFDLAEKVDLVVCNPPYISTAKLDGESAHLLAEEPREAFDAGPYGIIFQQRLLVEAAPFIRPGGWLAFEFGAGQNRQVRALFARAKGFEQPLFATDAEGQARVVLARRIQPASRTLA